MKTVNVRRSFGEGGKLLLLLSATVPADEPTEITAFYGNLLAVFLAEGQKLADFLKKESGVRNEKRRRPPLHMEMQVEEQAPFRYVRKVYATRGGVLLRKQVSIDTFDQVTRLPKKEHRLPRLLRSIREHLNCRHQPDRVKKTR